MLEDQEIESVFTGKGHKLSESHQVLTPQQIKERRARMFAPPVQQNYPETVMIAHNPVGLDKSNKLGTSESVSSTNKLDDLSSQMNEINLKRAQAYNRSHSVIIPKKVPYDPEDRKKIRLQMGARMIQTRCLSRSEKELYQRNIAALLPGDIRYMLPVYIDNPLFMEELYRYTENFDVMAEALNRWNKPPLIGMVIPLINKRNVTKHLAELYVYSYVSEDVDVGKFIRDSRILTHKSDAVLSCVEFVLDKFHTQNHFISTDLITYICENSEVTPEKFIAMVRRCSDKCQTTKSQLTFQSIPHRQLLEKQHRSIEHKYKMRFEVDYLN